jgi:hypothetical protein
MLGRGQCEEDRHLPGYRLAFERRKQFGVVAVDVLTETRNAAIDPSCQVGDMNWERITQIDHERFGRSDGAFNPFAVPALNATGLKDLVGKFEWPRQTDAAMAERTFP